MSLYQRFLNSLSKGPKLRCSISGRYFHRADMVEDGKGGYVSKIFDRYSRPNEPNREAPRTGTFRVKY